MTRGKTVHVETSMYIAMWFFPLLMYKGTFHTLLFSFAQFSVKLTNVLLLPLIFFTLLPLSQKNCEKPSDYGLLKLLHLDKIITRIIKYNSL